MGDERYTFLALGLAQDVAGAPAVAPADHADALDRLTDFAGEMPAALRAFIEHVADEARASAHPAAIVRIAAQRMATLIENGARGHSPTLERLEIDGLTAFDIARAKAGFDAAVAALEAR